ncbi:SpoIIE family protein phosphatase [Nocardia sp. BMG111209]|uniref:SpoIIE family protein phosphatase n=1 Tax=Nocardia sp. BMG111209 TaxID=1160137 RepID=UPI0003655A1C|nr:SpoIIE family protein phosphatase [Nocardia sp. BMG111209]
MCADTVADGRQWPMVPGFWRQVVDQLGFGLVVTGRDGRIVAANPATESLLGRTAETLRGKGFHDLVHGGTAGRERSPHRCALQGALTRHDIAHEGGDRFARLDGETIAVDWAVTPLSVDGARDGSAVLFGGATAEGEAWQARASQVSDLEDLIGRLTLVAEVTAVLSQTLETGEMLARLGRLLIPRLADWTAVDLRVDGDHVDRVAVTGPDDRDTGHEQWLGRLPAMDQASQSALVGVLRTGEPILLDREIITGPPDSAVAAVHTGFLHAIGAASALTVPLSSGRQVTGALTVVRTDPARPFDNEDRQAVVDIGRRVGQLLDNSLRFDRQRTVAEAMQRNLLAPLPQPGRLRLAARYQPAPAASQVGGDWYDAFALRDGTTALVIGDVVGHDLTAAAGMAQLRGILRSLAWDHAEPPSVIVDLLDDAMPAITTVPMATLVLARVEGSPDGPWTLHWTSAGHPPPLLVTPDRRARYLDDGQGLLLGTRLATPGDRPDATAPLPPGSTLLLYTDGLIETPGIDLDTGFGLLRRHALALTHEPLEKLCDELLARMPTGTDDDVALLALRLPTP